MAQIRVGVSKCWIAKAVRPYVGGCGKGFVSLISSRRVECYVGQKAEAKVWHNTWKAKIGSTRLGSRVLQSWAVNCC